MFVLSKQLLKMRAGQEEEGHHRRRGATEFFLSFPSGRFDFLGMQPVRTLGHDGRSHVISIPPPLFSIPRESKRKTENEETSEGSRSHVELHTYYYSLLFSLCDEKRNLFRTPYYRVFLHDLLYPTERYCFLPSFPQKKKS